MSARFENSCGGMFGAPCPDAEIAIGALDPSIWTMALGPKPNTTFGPNARYLEAVAPGTGGVEVTAQGKAFPPLTLRAVAPAGFRFLRADDGRANAPVTVTGAVAGTVDFAAGGTTGTLAVDAK